MRFLAQLDGYLDSTPSSDPVGAARDYLSDQAEAFGVEPSDIADLRVSDRESGEGIHSLEFTQSVDGVPIVDSSLEAHLDDDGRCGDHRRPRARSHSRSTRADVPRSDAMDAAADGVAGPVTRTAARSWPTAPGTSCGWPGA